MKQDFIDLYIATLHKIARYENAELFLVGGAVRDYIMDREVRDYDFVIFGNIDKITKRFLDSMDCKCIKYNKKLKTYRIFCKLKNIDVTEPRGKTIEHDLALRDLTINSIGYDLNANKIIDPQGGIKDIERKIIRANYAHSFLDDPVRILRAFRLAALFRFDIDPKTIIQAKQYAYMLKKVSKERIVEEIKRFFALRRTFAYILIMDKVGIIDTVFEDLTMTNGCIQSEHHLFDVKTHSLNVYNFIEWSYNRLERILGKCHKKYLIHTIENRANVITAMKLAALFHDAGKPYSKTIDSTGHVHFANHELKSLDIFNKYAKMYPFGKRVCKLTRFFIVKHVEPAYFYSLWKKFPQKDDIAVDFFMEYGDYGVDLLFFALADTLAKGKISADNRVYYIEFLKEMTCYYYNHLKALIEKKSLIDGNDLIEHFNMTGYELKEILKTVKRAEILGNIHTKQEALDFAVSIYNQPYAH